MRIKLSSIFVDDQARAAEFYSEVLGFEIKHDIPLGGGLRWLTLIASGRDDLELVLEPNENPAAETYQKALFEQGIPITAFEVDDVDAQYSRLTEKGVSFKAEPANQGPVRIAVLSDGCGNWIQLYQPLG